MNCGPFIPSYLSLRFQVAPAVRDGADVQWRGRSESLRCSTAPRISTRQPCFKQINRVSRTCTLSASHAAFLKPSTKVDDEFEVHAAYAAWILHQWKPAEPYVPKPPMPQAMQAKVADPREHKLNVFKSPFVTSIGARCFVASVFNFASGRSRTST